MEEIPARLSGTEALTVARKHLVARDPRVAEDAKRQGQPVEEPLEIDYEIVPYSPTENSKAAQVKKLTQFLPSLIQNPNIDQRKLMAHLLEVLDIGADVLLSAAQLQQQQQMQQMQQQAGAQAQDMANEQMPDTLASGGMPPSVPEVPTPAIGAMEGGAGFPMPERGGI